MKSPALTFARPADAAGFDWAAIEAETAECWAKICARLPQENVEIRFNHLPRLIVPEIGIGGYCPGGNLIFLTLERGRAHWRIDLPRTLAHEAHHCARWRTVGYGRTLGEALVTEGLADHFVVELYGEPAGPWIRALTDAELAAVHPRALPLLWEKSYDHRAWFFGSPAQALPRWAGYSLGYHLVARYLATHPFARASQLAATPAHEILHSDAMHP